MTEVGILRRIRADEIEQILGWRNHPSVREHSFDTRVIDLQEHKSWWARISQSEADMVLMYEDKGGPAGVVLFREINQISQNASWAFYASPLSKKGVGGKMEFLALEYAFRELNLHKLYCEVLAFNQSVIRLHQKFGFAIEGVFKEQYWREGEYFDVYRLGILAHQWQACSDEIRDRLVRMEARAK